MSEINEALTETLNSVITSLINFIPRFVSGLIVLVIGIIIASFIKQATLEVFRFFKVEARLKKYGINPRTDTVKWTDIIAELLRWFVIILFLIPTAQVWGLGGFAELLNGLLLYLPNVFIAVLILLVGFVISRLVYDIILASLPNVSKSTARTVALVGRWSIMIFTILVVLNQLGIASDLIRILFTGVVAMIALAGGLAFGLGGKGVAEELLRELKKKL